MDFLYSNICKYNLDCDQPLGLESFKIKDINIKWDDDFVQSDKVGKYARLNFNQAWCIKNIPNGDRNMFCEKCYVEIDLSKMHKVNAIALQGHRLYSYGERLSIMYSSTVRSIFVWYKVDNNKYVSIIFC